MKKLLLLAFLFVTTIHFITAQTTQGTLQGYVFDSENNPLENAYVFDKQTNSHAHSDKGGKFILANVRKGDTIQIGLLGYKQYKLIVENKDLQKDVKIQLETKVFELDELVIANELDPLQTIAKLDLKVNPVNSSQEILRKVPGLFIGQHAGGGKAEQIFLRGFDVDHGTDVALSVDGMPVNMVSHAHGQGYSDLHFLIPETIQKINFGKGVYYADKGDFNTAGFVDFSTKKSINQNVIKAEVGDFNTLRTLGMFNLLEPTNTSKSYVALEYIETDGPFESPQNFNRINIFGKYHTILNNLDQVTVAISNFTSKWDASGQIPQREVDNGNITRFGSIDDTEGGRTSRFNVNLQHLKNLENNATIHTNVYYSKYDFELYSNFTFFLEDPINGDQIKQKESREIYGFNSELKRQIDKGNIQFHNKKGIGARIDNVNNIELSKTRNRTETLEQTQLGDVQQTNIYAFYDSKIDFGKFVINPAFRLDYFNFQYVDKLSSSYQTLSNTKTIVNPKLNFFYNAADNVQFFLKSGIGFHSNDARVVLQENANNILPRAYGTDVGTIWKPLKNMVFNTAFWYLFSEEEFVYVGDAGVIEPSGKSERYGLDLGLRFQLTDWLYFDSDATYTVARSVDEMAGQDYIPLAPDFTITGGLSATNFKGFSGGFRFRYLDNRPANEDNSIVAKGYFVNDINVNYTYKNITFGMVIENLFDVDWNETQFETTSRLQNEIEPVTEIHFTPGTPFFAKASLSVRL